MSFTQGFSKVAELASTLDENAKQDAIIGTFVPFGTTLSTAFGKRPKDHSRMSEWRHRVGGSILGGTGGAVIGSVLGPIGAAIGSGAGRMAGEHWGSKASTKHHYDEEGKLKKKSREQED